VLLLHRGWDATGVCALDDPRRELLSGSGCASAHRDVPHLTSAHRRFSEARPGQAGAGRRQSDALVGRAGPTEPDSPPTVDQRPSRRATLA
jgi:hypothetical protein